MNIRVQFHTAMNNNRVHQNKTSRGGKAGSNSLAPILEATQHSELVKKNNLISSNGSDNGPVGVGYSFAEPSRKRTMRTSCYDDCKRNCRGAAGSECKSLASIKELVNKSQQSFEPYKGQQNTTSLIDTSLVSLHSESNCYTDQYLYGGTNGVSSSAAASHGTLNNVTKGLTINGYMANGNGVGTLASETFSSPLQVARQSPKMGTHEQTVHEVSVNGDLGTARMRTANREQAEPKCKQFETISVSYGSTGGSNNGIHMSTETIGLMRLGQNLGPDQVSEKKLQNIQQQCRQSAISKSSGCYKTESYSYVQSSLHNHIQNSHSVSFSENLESQVLLKSHPGNETFL